ncbi:hypothetical protein [Planctomyces sp. SH-PL62]|nr:hypothetical protein [Planctomyces sp. SH-PL62]AMV37725.1 hypothetical protein VT85_09835 [Planctomyces sp. SH-PL62]
MSILTQIPALHAAIEYSLLYMLLGGGVVGAVVVYGVAKAFNR